MAEESGERHMYRVQREEGGTPREVLGVWPSIDEVKVNVRLSKRPGVYAAYEEAPSAIEGLHVPTERARMVLTPAGHLWEHMEHMESGAIYPHDYRREDGWFAYATEQRAGRWTLCRPRDEVRVRTMPIGPMEVDAVLGKIDEEIDKLP